MSSTAREFTRRAMLRSALLLVAAPPFAGCARDAAEAPFLSNGDLALLDALADVIIPETGTPGARSVGVAGFIHDLMSGWASDESRAAVRAALDDLHATHPGLPQYAEGERERVVAAYDAAAFATAPPTPASTGYRLLKRLIFHGYYLSDVGATQELQWQAAPGPQARNDAPLVDVGRAHAE